MKIDNAKKLNSGVTVIIPAYNESRTIADTIESLKMQSVPPEEIIVVDDCSTDGTGDVARSFGVTVVRPPLKYRFKSRSTELCTPNGTN